MLLCSFQTVITSKGDKERHVTFHHLPEKNEGLAKKWLDQLYVAMKRDLGC